MRYRPSKFLYFRTVGTAADQNEYVISADGRYKVRCAPNEYAKHLVPGRLVAKLGIHQSPIAPAAA